MGKKFMGKISSGFILNFGDTIDITDRFVYYETLVTSMKSLGVREPVISYDDLKVAATLDHSWELAFSTFCSESKIYLSIAATSGWVREKASIWVCWERCLAGSIRWITIYKSRHWNNQRSLLLEVLQTNVESAALLAASGRLQFTKVGIETLKVHYYNISFTIYKCRNWNNQRSLL